MEYEVTITGKADKGIDKLPPVERGKMVSLIEKIRETGPVQPIFKNYSKLGKNTYHCHLSYSWVACWRCEDKEITVEVYYVGSRENAPY